MPGYSLDLAQAYVVMYPPPLPIHLVSKTFTGHEHLLPFALLVFECAFQTRQMRRMDKASVNGKR
jgi:hypothetical protein